MIRPVRGRIALSVFIGAVRIAASLGFVWICKRLVDIATGELNAPELFEPDLSRARRVQPDRPAKARRQLVPAPVQGEAEDDLQE